jgi:hypothetical protein
MKSLCIALVGVVAMSVLMSGSSRVERTCRQWFERCLGNRPAIAGSMMGTCEARYEKAKQSGYWVRGKTGVPCRR